MTTKELIERLRDCKGIHDKRICQRAADRLAELDAVVDRLHNGTDAPDLYAGEMLTGLKCGVEDRDLRDRYDGAEYGWNDAAERFFEWVHNETSAALAASATGKGESNG